MSIRPLSGVNLIAFETRFTNTFAHISRIDHQKGILQTEISTYVDMPFLAKTLKGISNSDKKLDKIRGTLIQHHLVYVQFPKSISSLTRESKYREFRSAICNCAFTASSCVSFKACSMGP